MIANFLPIRLSNQEVMFVFTSHQKRLNTRSFLKWDFWEEKGSTGDYAGLRLTRCNVSQMTLLDMDSLDVTWVWLVCLLIAWTRPYAVLLIQFTYPKVSQPFSLEYHQIKRLPHSGYCNILTNKREITSDATGVTAPTTSGGFGQ